MPHVDANVINAAFRAYDDDVAGAITAQTPLAATDTDITIAADTTFHVAMMITETAGGDAKNVSMSVNYRVDGGGWLDLTEATPIQTTTATNCTTSEAASYGTTGLADGSTLIASEYDNVSDPATTSFSLLSASAEMTTCLTLDSAQVTAGEVYELRMTDNGAAFASDAIIIAITVAAAGPTTITGTGALDLGAQEVAGSGEVTKTGSGALNSPAQEVAGSGALVKTGSGALNNPAQEVAGVGGPVKTGTGALDLGAQEIAASGTITKTGSGALGIPAQSLSGVGEITKTGSGSLDLGAQEVAGSGEVTKTGSGALDLGAQEVAGVGGPVKTGTGSLDLGAQEVAGSGTITKTGSGALGIPAQSLSGVGEIVKTGTGALDLGAQAVSGEGSVTGAALATVVGAARTSIGRTGRGDFTNDAVVITFPAISGAAIGDTVYLFVTADSSGTATGPSGWTDIIVNASTATDFAVCSKVITTGDSDYTSIGGSWEMGNGWNAFIVIVSGTHTLEASAQADNASGFAYIPAITTFNADDLSIAFGTADDQNVLLTPPTGWALFDVAGTSEGTADYGDETDFAGGGLSSAAVAFKKSAGGTEGGTGVLWGNQADDGWSGVQLRFSNIAEPEAGTTKTGTGALSLAGVTASGSGFITKTGSGALNSPAQEVAASGAITKTGSGSLDLIAQTLAASGGPVKTGSGSLDLIAQLLAASGAISRSGSGSLDLGAQAVSSVGEIIKTGTGALDLIAQVIAGSGLIQKTGSGSLDLGAQEVAGSGAVAGTTTGSGALDLIAQVIAGSASVVKTGSGDIVIIAQTLAGSGSITRLGSGSLDLGAQEVAGSGAVSGAVSGSGALSIASQLLSGSGFITRVGVGDLALAGQLLSGSGLRSIVGAGAVTIAPQAVAGLASVVKTGSGSLDLIAQLLAGGGGVGAIISGSGTLNLTAQDVEGVGSIVKTASAALTIAAQVASGSGVISVTGSGELIAGAYLVAGSGAIQKVGSGDLSIPAIELQGTGNLSLSGSGALDLPAITLAGFSVIPIIGDLVIGAPDAVLVIIGAPDGATPTQVVTGCPYPELDIEGRSEMATNQTINGVQGQDLELSVRVRDRDQAVLTDLGNVTVSLIVATYAGGPAVATFDSDGSQITLADAGTGQYTIALDYGDDLAAFVTPGNAQQYAIWTFNSVTDESLLQASGRLVFVPATGGEI